MPEIEIERVRLSDGGWATVTVHGTKRSDGAVVYRFVHDGRLDSGEPLTREQMDEAAQILGL